MERDYRYDLMRVIAAFFVIVIHVCAMQWKTLDIYSSKWAMIHIYDMLAKFSVPLFFMISGRFLLDPNRTENSMTIQKKIFRIVIAFLFWTVIYTVLTLVRLHSTGKAIRPNLSWIITEFFSGEYHMWYLYAIAGLYLVTPFLRKITTEKKLMEYFLLLAFVFQFFSEAVLRIPGIHIIAEVMLKEMSLFLPLGFTGYFVLGYYLYQYPPSKKKRAVILVVGIIGAIVSCVLSYSDSMRRGVADESAASYLSMNVLAMTAAVYTVFLSLKSSKTGRGHAYLSRISRLSLGIYLIHPAFLWIFEWLRFYPTFVHPILGVPAMTIVVFTLSIWASDLIQKIPRIGRLIA